MYITHFIEDTRIRGIDGATLIIIIDSCYIKYFFHMVIDSNNVIYNTKQISMNGLAHTKQKIFEQMNILTFIFGTCDRVRYTFLLYLLSSDNESTLNLLIIFIIILLDLNVWWTAAVDENISLIDWMT